MSIKLIACDLDGTLMAPDHLTVTPRTYNALYAAHQKGIKTAIATGRTLGFTVGAVEQIPFVDYIIYSNGACVFDNTAKKDIYRNCISAENTAEILSLLEQQELYYNAYSDGRVYVQRNKEQFYKNRELPKPFLDMFISCSCECESMLETLKGREAEIVAMYSMSEEQKASLLEKFERMGLHITSSLPDELEVTAPSVNKGTAITGLCRAVGIDVKNVMAFGDAMNDREMLEAVGHPFAMGNACDELKSIIKNIAPTNAEDGVAVEVEKIL